MPFAFPTCYAALAGLLLGMAEPLLISVKPSPIIAGGTAEIAYDFPPDGPNSVVLEILWTGSPPVTDSVTVTRSNPSVKVNVPDTADGVLITDQSGQSIDFGGIVLPPPAPEPLPPGGR